MKKILLGDESLVIFARIGDSTVGLDIHEVVSVIEPKNVRTVPLVPKCFQSILNYQGSIVTLFDIKNYFKLNDSTSIEEKKAIYLKHKEMKIGILVDSIFKIDYVSPSFIEPCHDIEEDTIGSTFCKGIFLPDENSQEIYLLDTKSILDCVEGYDMNCDSSLI